MPGMNGVDMCRKIKRAPRHPKLVMISSLCNCMSQVGELSENVFDHHIPKETGDTFPKMIRNYCKTLLIKKFSKKISQNVQFPTSLVIA